MTWKYLALMTNNARECPHKEKDGRKRSYWFMYGNSVKNMRKRVHYEIIHMGYVDARYIIIDHATHELVWSMTQDVKTTRDWMKKWKDFKDGATVDDFLAIASKY